MLTLVTLLVLGHNALSGELLTVENILIDDLD